MAIQWLKSCEEKHHYKGVGQMPILILCVMYMEEYIRLDVFKVHAFQKKKIM